MPGGDRFINQDNPYVSFKTSVHETGRYAILPVGLELQADGYAVYDRADAEIIGEFETQAKAKAFIRDEIALVDK